MRRVPRISDSLNNNLNEINKISRSDKSRFSTRNLFSRCIKLHSSGRTHSCKIIYYYYNRPISNRSTNGLCAYHTPICCRW